MSITTKTSDSTTRQSNLLASVLKPSATFVRRHFGASAEDVQEMLQTMGADSLEQLVVQTVPASIRLTRPLNLGEPRGEHELLAELKAIACKNKVFRSYIGMGYSDTIVPPVIQRNILENPGYYTQYTPYQAEISQGRLEALLNFQTMISDLTALPLANASLLDEGTAAAEAMAMCFAVADHKRPTFFVANDCHPQTIAVVQTRADSLGIKLIVGDVAQPLPRDICGVLVQYPTTDGRIVDYSDVVKHAHAAGALVVFAADLLALTLIKPPGEFGADIAVGSSQRFGVPMGYGGPHAAYMSCKQEYVRKMPGRIIGVSKDANGNPAYRLTLQTREQHIRREKATSNICTAQVLLAIMAGMYAVYHGPEGLRRIALRVHALTALLAAGLRKLGHKIPDGPFFDTLRVQVVGVMHDSVLAAAQVRGMNFRAYDEGEIGVSLDETTTRADVELILQCFIQQGSPGIRVPQLADVPTEFEPAIARTSGYLTHPVFNTHHSETEMLRYIFKLQSRDLSLAQAMIPLGSCTMKLNATSEMIPVTWPEFSRIHPFAPLDQVGGYLEMFAQLEKWLAEITGFAAVLLEPNAGSQGEYAGLLAIHK
jgi:glycine dehydrogenase